MSRGADMRWLHVDDLRPSKADLINQNPRRIAKSDLKSGNARFSQTSNSDICATRRLGHLGVGNLKSILESVVG